MTTAPASPSTPSGPTRLVAARDAVSDLATFTENLASVVATDGPLTANGALNALGLDINSGVPDMMASVATARGYIRVLFAQIQAKGPVSTQAGNLSWSPDTVRFSIVQAA